MGKIYLNQTKLRLIADTKTDITGSTTLEIRYRKPDATTGNFTGTMLSATDGTIFHDIQNSSDLDVSGTWKFWADVLFGDGRYALGEPYSIKIHVESF